MHWIQTTAKEKEMRKNINGDLEIRDVTARFFWERSHVLSKASHKDIPTLLRLIQKFDQSALCFLALFSNPNWDLEMLFVVLNTEDFDPIWPLLIKNHRFEEETAWLKITKSFNSPQVRLAILSHTDMDDETLCEALKKHGLDLETLKVIGGRKHIPTDLSKTLIELLLNMS